MRKGLPTPQWLVGLWLLLGGISLAGGAIFAAWLDSRLALEPAARLLMWLCALSGGATLLAVGYLLERYLFKPLRTLHAELGKLIAHPDKPIDAPGGWLESLGPDLCQIARRWRDDRERLKNAHRDGAREAARIRQELEGLIERLPTPVLLFDQHGRLLLFNPAASALFPSPFNLGLGKELKHLLPDPVLAARFNALVEAMDADDTFSRDVLTSAFERTISVSLTRLSSTPCEILVTLKDVTRVWQNELGVRKRLTLTLDSLEQTVPASSLSTLRELWHHSELVNERLSSIWSNAFWHTLDEQLNPSLKLITPIGVPGWFKGHAPSLIALFDLLVTQLHGQLPQCRFEGSLVHEEKGVWLAFIWQGGAIEQTRLNQWRNAVIDSLPLSPTVGDILGLHGSELWSEQDADGVHARLCVSLKSSTRQSAPDPDIASRPEFHDFDIARLAPPQTPLSERALDQLAIVAFDTETTGLDLRGADTLLSLGACRIVNNRLLARDVFERYINPKRAIPAASTAIHGIRDEDVRDAPAASVVLEAFETYAREAVLLAHNASFDLLALSQAGKRLSHPILDTLLISKALDSALPGHDLESQAKRYGLSIPPGARHTALGDAQLTAELWLSMLPRLKARKILTLDQLLAFQASALDRRDGSL
ncbi:exonuclease domain-containing protein [Halomonas sp. PAMB 3264]|uniref:3'-5' exonuclease n=1 Tax=Halomonas sp. PAMB 3264 TaxID=3075222 RepID=UPI00289FB08F|nr:exonuclease domain-containing protein [Halomonas sp. PAMB 3264]WNL40685.1 exonuclease domain-containing protein [Halomonas sp. PAMB 3264]